MIIELMAAALSSAAPVATIDYAGDAKALDRLIVENYAYEDHWPGGVLPDSPTLKREREAVHDRDSLKHYAEDRIASLADHHAITGSSFSDSWAIVPTYCDLWVVRRGDQFVIDAVRPDSPAATAGIVTGDGIDAIGGVPAVQAIGAFWQGLGLGVTDERAAYAARVLAAGRRDRPRDLTIVHGNTSRRVSLPSLYTLHSDRRAVSVDKTSDATVIRINNSLGDQATIAAFDQAMAAVDPRAPLTIDLTDTPSGGNTSVARAMMGWFVAAPTSYQVHQLPSEERETGIARQWIEQVLPRSGKYHRGLPTIRVGRWTGSMGEGLAIGFAAIGSRVEGTAMAQLKGAVYDIPLPSSGLVVKIPVERLYTVGGTPRERFIPRFQKGNP